MPVDVSTTGCFPVGGFARGTFRPRDVPAVAESGTFRPWSMLAAQQTFRVAAQRTFRLAAKLTFRLAAQRTFKLAALRTFRLDAQGIG